MLWFNKNKKKREYQEDFQKSVSIEVQKHQQKTDKTLAETQKVTDNFNRIIKDNGFTLKIHVAAGGKR